MSPSGPPLACAALNINSAHAITAAQNVRLTDFNCTVTMATFQRGSAPVAGLGLSAATRQRE